MDISKWPLDQIMQLPDYVFGRRWLVAMGVLATGGVDVYAIAPTGLPDRGVIWEMGVIAPFAITMDVLVEFGWGDQLPTTNAQWQGLQKMFPCQGFQGARGWHLHGAGKGELTVRRLKMPTPAAGLRPVMRVDRDTTPDTEISAWFVYSSLPRQIPVCHFLL